MSARALRNSTPGSRLRAAYLRGLGLQQSYITPELAYTWATDVVRLLARLASGRR